MFWKKRLDLLDCKGVDFFGGRQRGCKLLKIKGKWRVTSGEIQRGDPPAPRGNSDGQNEGLARRRSGGQAGKGNVVKTKGKQEARWMTSLGRKTGKWELEVAKRTSQILIARNELTVK